MKSYFYGQITDMARIYYALHARLSNVHAPLFMNIDVCVLIILILPHTLILYTFFSFFSLQRGLFIVLTINQVAINMSFLK